jgi:Zn ribbon nucleic-acid-binding protein
VADDAAARTMTAHERRLVECSLSKWDGDPANCRWCGEALPRNNDGSLHKTRRYCNQGCSNGWYRNHVWTGARHAAIERDGKCLKCGAQGPLEVNHKVQVFGRHSASGCHHHLDILETLCHSCHLEVTNEQRRGGYTSGAICPKCQSDARQRYQRRPDLEPREERHRCYDCGYDSGWQLLAVKQEQLSLG